MKRNHLEAEAHARSYTPTEADEKLARALYGKTSPELFASSSAPSPAAVAGDDAGLRALYPNSPQLFPSSEPTSTPPAAQREPGAPAGQVDWRRLYPNSPELFAPKQTEKPEPVDPALVSMYPSMFPPAVREAARESAVAADLVQMNESWRQAVRADPEIGHDALDGTVAAADEALETLGTPELRDFLHETGLGDHPELLRFLARAGKKLGRGR